MYLWIKVVKYAYLFFFFYRFDCPSTWSCCWMRPHTDSRPWRTVLLKSKLHQHEMWWFVSQWMWLMTKVLVALPAICSESTFVVTFYCCSSWCWRRAAISDWGTSWMSFHVFLYSQLHVRRAYVSYLMAQQTSLCPLREHIRAHKTVPYPSHSCLYVIVFFLFVFSFHEYHIQIIDFVCKKVR